MNGAGNGLRMLRRLVLAMLLAGAPSLAIAQDTHLNHGYPNRPIKIIVPFAAGGIADVLTRLIGERVALKWGGAVIVENRPGASGNLGAESVARAEPDGYTLLSTPPPPLAVNQSLFPKLGFDPTAFAPITIIAAVPNVLVVHPKVPAASLQELVAFAKANPDKLSYGSTGSGGTPHLTAELFKVTASVRIVHVPYKGVPPAFVDLLGGQVDMMFINLGDSLQHIKSGKLKALGIGSRARLPGLPDVPAISEVLPSFVSDTWFAVVAPPKTPPEIAAKISFEMAEILKAADVSKRLLDLSVTRVGSSPAETAAHIKQESQRWREVIVTAGIKPD
jgi:tripartite-type tricarboxylate transporter receptor subunit TctC